MKDSTQGDTDMKHKCSFKLKTSYKHQQLSVKKMMISGICNEQIPEQQIEYRNFLKYIRAFEVKVTIIYFQVLLL